LTIAKFLADKVDVLQTMYNLPLSAASAVALNQCSANFHCDGQTAFSVARKGSCLFLKARFETYAVFSYITCYMAMIC